ncbi:MAG: ATP-binding protein [Clostridia bacterium]|nr:ATP-binding protein [Clostridia bacterium]
MLNRETAYSLAFEEQRNALKRKTALYEKALEELKAKNNRIDEIDRTLKALGAKIGITVLSGDLKELDRMQKLITALAEERDAILQKNGVTPAEFSCQLCKDTGYIDGKVCSCIKDAAKKLLIKSLSEELPLEECRFERFDLKYYPDEDTPAGNPRRRMETLLKLCKDYAESFSPSSPSLLFMGDAGLGKTHLSLSIVYELLSRGFDVIYGSAYNLLSAMENDHFQNRTNESFSAAVTCDLLVIDDLGSEFVSPYIQSMFYNVINTRLLANRPTIINTNLNMKEIEQRYSARISSRFIGGYTAKKFIGNDIRQIKMTEKK